MKGADVVQLLLSARDMFLGPKNSFGRFGGSGFRAQVWGSKFWDLGF